MKPEPYIIIFLVFVITALLLTNHYQFMDRYNLGFDDGFRQAMQHTKPQEMIPAYSPAYKVIIKGTEKNKKYVLERRGDEGAIPMVILENNATIKYCTIIASEKQAPGL